MAGLCREQADYGVYCVQSTAVPPLSHINRFTVTPNHPPFRLPSADIKQGDLFGFFFSLYCFQHCFICRPSDSTVSEDTGIEPRTVAPSALAVRRSNNIGYISSADTTPNQILRRHLYWPLPSSIVYSTVEEKRRGYPSKKFTKHIFAHWVFFIEKRKRRTIGNHSEQPHRKWSSDNKKM